MGSAIGGNFDQFRVGWVQIIPAGTAAIGTEPVRANRKGRFN
jgi:hypothetical protein